MTTASPSTDAVDRRLAADLRTDHAGETGAVWIYRGVLAVARDPDLRAFATRHLETEARHLELIGGLCPANERSLLTPVWRVAGWITGAAPALFGPSAVYQTIEAVETFVDKHYQEQIDYLADAGTRGDVLAILKECQADEVSHRDEAAAKAGSAGPLARAWAAIVGAGSKAAVGAARYV